MKYKKKHIGCVIVSTLCLLSSSAYARFKLQINNNSLQSVTISPQINASIGGSSPGNINPGTQWTSGWSGGNISINIPEYGPIGIQDIGTDHIEGDSSEYLGLLVTYQDMDIVGRYPNGDGGLTISIGRYGDVSLAGNSFDGSVFEMTLSNVVINRFNHS